MMDIDLEIVCTIVHTMVNGSIPDLTSEPSASRTESVETVVSDVYDVATIALVLLDVLDLGTVTFALRTASVEVFVPDV